MTSRSADRLDHPALAVLGVLTICTYGSWYYAFGVLLDPIREETGWGESALAASFSSGTVLIGLGSVIGGRMLDRLGMRAVFLLAAAVGGLAFVGASVATDVVVFGGAAAVGMGVFGSLGFYHITMTVAVRVHPRAPTRAIAVLTLWGALASAIFLPVAAWLVERFDWRLTTRLLSSSAVVMFVVAAVFVREEESPPSSSPPSLGRFVRTLMTSPASRALTGAVAFGGISLATLLVYQVPAMTAAGLPLATAATVAGVRGLFQLSGRLPIAALVGWLGIDPALILAFGAMAVGAALLTASGTVPVALTFSVLAGFGIGAFSPLQGMKTEQLYERSTLGAAMGFQGTVLMLAGSIGPVVSGLLADWTGDRRWAAGIAALAAVIAAGFSIRGARRSAQGV